MDVLVLLDLLETRTDPWRVASSLECLLVELSETLGIEGSFEMLKSQCELQDLDVCDKSESVDHVVTDEHLRTSDLLVLALDEARSSERRRRSGEESESTRADHGRYEDGAGRMG